MYVPTSRHIHQLTFSIAQGTGNRSPNWEKNYIANEQGHWDTSKALVRRTLERCIHHGRQNRANGQKQDEYEAFRLLGQSVRDQIRVFLGLITTVRKQLHTLEDFSAHSNFCELALVSLGPP